MTEFILKARKIHGDIYDYSKSEYKDMNTIICIICPKHGIFWQTPYNHICGEGCPYCGQIKKLKDSTIGFIESAKLIYGDIYDYTKVKYINSEKKVCITCPKHGDFWKSPHAHICGEGCPHCGKNINFTKKNFLKSSKIIYGSIYDYSKVKFIDLKTEVCIICQKHGKFYQKPYAHIRGEGCPHCEEERRIKLEKEIFLKKAKDVHMDKYDYSKVVYKNMDYKVCITCSKHGDFWQTPYTHISGHGCPSCGQIIPNKNSKISKKVEDKLKELNISFTKEQTFDWLKCKTNMYIDFYLPDYNIAIECHGLQHFEPVNFFGGAEGYNERKYRDMLKYKLCSDHNIKIYYFSEYNTNYFEKIYCDENVLMEDICKSKYEG